jgi:hypothetical protein
MQLANTWQTGIVQSGVLLGNLNWDIYILKKKKKNWDIYVIAQMLYP